MIGNAIVENINGFDIKELFVNVVVLKLLNLMYRRHQIGFVELASPVTHVWYVKGRPSKIALILNISLKDLEQIVYFNSYVVLDPGNSSELKYKQLLVETDWQVFDASNPDITGIDISIGAEAIKTL